MPESPELDLVPTTEALAIAKVSRRTLVDLIARGELTVYRRAGEGRNYHDRAELEELARYKAMVRPTRRRVVVLPEAGVRS